MPTLHDLLSTYPGHVQSDPAFDDCEIASVAFDSREVKKDGMFVALKGGKADGNAYIADAVARRVRAVVTDAVSDVGELPKHVALVRVAEPRLALAKMAARFYDRQPETIVAVTGTDGKTSTVHFARTLWEMLGYKAASIGTLGIIGEGGEMCYEGTHTTPDPVALHRILAELAEAGYTHLAMEASSHGLDQYRLDGVDIQAAAFTNFTRDHLDYHETPEAYFAAKARLFTEVLAPRGSAILNIGDEEVRTLIEAVTMRGGQVIEYGHGARNLRILTNAPVEGGQAVRLAVSGHEYDFILPLVGGFQLYNVLAAVGMIAATGEDTARVIPLLTRITGVRGRVEKVARHISGAQIFIDYAHTPAALGRILETLRPHVKNRLLVVFGCGGDRDRGKRPEMGSLAAGLADVVVVTDDNPRSEDAATIRREIMAACPGAIEIGDRRLAIHAAMDMLEAGDILLIAGKGHEAHQIIGEEKHPFDDAAVVREKIR